MDFLSLCKMTARESGTVAPSALTTVTGQSGRLEKVVYWTAEAWRLIQLAENRWRWMRGEFSGAITQGTSRYTSGSFSLSRFAAWVTDEGWYRPMSVYVSATGVSDEGPLQEIGWESWRQNYGRGSQVQNRPVAYAISPADEICLGPIPNAGYTLKGEYWKSAQELTANADVPECPAQFHPIIAWRAVMLLDQNDEAIDAIRIGRAKREFREMMEAMRRTQLPTIRLGGGPLA